MITVIIPTLNERASIAELVTGVLIGAGVELVEIIVSDGGSDDGTPDIVAGLAACEPRVKLLHNPRRTQAAAVNLAVAQANQRTTVLVRLDAHAVYPPGYVGVVARLLEETGADSVVVRLLSRGESCFQRAVAAVSNSALGTGGSSHRVGGVSRWIDHGHHAVFRRDSFERIGGYDERFPANEDAEFDARLRKAGGRIWFASDVKVIYFPRRTAASLARQYYRYGAGRARNFLKHSGPLKLRHLAPPLLLLATLLSVVAAAVGDVWLLILPAGYLAMICGAAGVLALRRSQVCMVGAAIALPVMHFAWGAGFLVALGYRWMFIRDRKAGYEPACSVIRRDPGDLGRSM